MRKIVGVFMLGIVVLMLGLSAGCSWMGETAGRAKAAVENGVEDTQDGYHKGYEEGKSDKK